jgi:hypothetical protein
MKASLRRIAMHLGTPVIFFCSGSVLLAQWAPYVVPGIPLKADGTPNLAAPTPRTPDGKPDLSGVWQTVREKASATAPGQNPRTPFFDIGVGIPGGLPLTPYGAEIRKKRLAENGKDDPDANCLPLNVARYHFGGDPRKILQGRNLIIMLFETNGGVRQIFTDGRPLPKDPQPWWFGYSVGSWQGDTLVVTTTGLRDDQWLDVEGSPLTDAATITERFRRPNFGTLEIEATVEDSKAYTKPWTVQVKQRFLPSDELMEYICQENERDKAHYTTR